jgi:ADP-heptose:LPS heptosyltransferase
VGWGDELMAAGQARREQARLGTSDKVLICDRLGAIREHAAWANNPRIATRSDRVSGKWPRVTNGPGARPYIAEKHDSHWVWREWDCPDPEIYLTADERKFGERFSPDVVIEPNLKAKASPNKDWGRARWQELADLLQAAGRAVYQLGPAGTQVLRGAFLIETPTLRHACAVLARAQAAILPEGGLHHSAAALGVPAVVIFGGFISPRQTGHAGQVSLFTGGKPCGARSACAHCADAMAAITPSEVFSLAAGLKKEQR